MKDRYLYRAKRTDNVEWIIGNLLLDIEKAKTLETYRIYPVDYVDICRIVDPSTICQCTGLNDRNGKMIWENDIVQYEGILFAVKWNDACAHFAACEIRERIRRTPVMNRGTMKITEVVGNIFDNPELWRWENE